LFGLPKANSFNTRKMVEYRNLWLARTSTAQKMPQLQPRKNNKLTRLLTTQSKQKLHIILTWNLPAPSEAKKECCIQITQDILFKTLKFLYIALHRGRVHATLATRAYMSVTTAHGWHAIRRHWGHPKSTHWRRRSKASSHTCWASHSRHWWCRQSKRQ